MILKAVLITSLSLSLIVNISMIWYIRSLLKNLLFITENVLELQEEVASYKGHLGSIYELEMFYGEETLGSLLQHGTELMDSFKKFDYFIELLESNESEQGIDEEETTEEEQEVPNDDSTSSQKTSTQGKTVFYAGP